MEQSPDLPKASVLKRIMARLVDGLVAWALALVMPPVGILAGLLYLAAADGVQKGQSLGKMVFGLEVMTREGELCDLKGSIYRNIPFVLALLFAAVPLLGWILLVIAGIPILLIELWLVIVDDHGNRLGDRIAGTTVVERVH
ncbi:MAG: RDD family protein [bacterium]|nr:RDD family protein [bacterium]MDT8395823.1 RDD family protein [bacterium]